KGLIVFKTEYQCCCQWAFRVRDAERDDPPVYIGSTEHHTSLKGWRIQSATFSGFMLQLLMVRSVHFASRFHACKDKVSRTLWSRVEKQFADLGFPDWFEYGKRCHLLGGDDCLLLVRSDPPWGMQTDLCLNARTLAGREKATQNLGIEWDCVEDPRPAED